MPPEHQGYTPPCLAPAQEEGQLDRFGATEGDNRDELGARGDLPLGFAMQPQPAADDGKGGAGGPPYPTSSSPGMLTGVGETGEGAVLGLQQLGKLVGRCRHPRYPWLRQLRLVKETRTHDPALFGQVRLPA